MAWQQDLSSFVGFGADCASCLRAVGWLERGRSFLTGPVKVAVYEKLLELLRDPWEPVVAMGLHNCDLCQYEGPPGSRNLYIPGDGIAFVCPELIAHFMNAHGYRPPDEFCTAVLACPPMRSQSYLKSILQVARPLVRSIG